MSEVQSIVLRFGQYKVSLSNDGMVGHELRSVVVLKGDKELPPRLWLSHGHEFEDHDAPWVSSKTLIEVLQTVKKFAELDLV